MLGQSICRRLPCRRFLAARSPAASCRSSACTYVQKSQCASSSRLLSSCALPAAGAGQHRLAAVARVQPMTAGAKRSMVKIGTHSGRFHCDEALGCYLLHQTKEFADGSVTRSRDPEVWKDMDVLIDVGAEYDPSRHRYDHHQRGFAEVFGHGYETKLSSAGLVYKHFGRAIIASRMGKPEEDAEVRAVWLQVYRAFIEAIDAIDNGINKFDTDAEPRFEEHTNLPSRVGFLNPAWNEAVGADAQDAQFQKAMALTGSEFEDAVKYTVSSWLPARGIVERALRDAPDVHASGEILKLSYCPWKSHLYDIEKEAGCEGKIKFVIYKDDSEGKWRVQAVNHPGSFALRKGLPAAWRGVRGVELDKVSGIEGCVFVHAAGFIGGNSTEAGALQMAAGGLAAQE